VYVWTEFLKDCVIGGPGHWQNGQWISAANGKSVEVVIPVLAAVALGMMAL
jgi:hypothetical protein